ncbi:hypothetical protein VPH35_068390 [Triticum aestivum]|uniref:uncharacterized protein n=1 Tax=Triticum aestivum TaxID=4565 RepID=UPI0003D5694D|nr:uncharacterized protein LOC123087700 [Triticum aestivum]XP_044365728.1 uncharacterized protein LOC123087700 [Triticum aestivum]
MVFLGWLKWRTKEQLQTDKKVTSVFVLNLRRGPPDGLKDRVPCPSRMSALEVSILKYAEQPDKSVVRPELGLSFDSLGEAYDFYNLYSWELGFGIRYGKSRLNAERTKGMQEIVCGCSGKPETGNSQSCICEFPALIRLLRASNNSWYITEHRASHNHSMSLTMGEKVHWPSHKHIDIYTKHLIKQLRENNVNLGKVYSIVGSFFGSVKKVPFTKRTLRSICGKISREQAEDDVQKTLEAFADIQANTIAKLILNFFERVAGIRWEVLSLNRQVVAQPEGRGMMRSWD